MKNLLKVLAPLLIVIILFIFVGNFGVSKVIDIRTQIKTSENSEATLTEKLNLLQTLSVTAASGENFIISAVPEANPVLIVISQLKILAGENGIVVSAFKSNNGVLNPSGLNEVDISFTAEGARPQVFSFLSGISQIAPITVTDVIKMSETAGTSKTDIGVKSYWADLPKTIPAVDAPITDLTAAEKETLTKITGLTQPAFTQPPPSQGGTNPNPFGE